MDSSASSDRDHPIRRDRRSRTSHGATDDSVEPHRIAVAHKRAHDAALARQTRLGAMSVALFLVIGSAALWCWHTERAAADEAKRRLQQAQSDLREELLTLHLDDPAQAERAMQRLEATRSEWQAWPSAAQFAELASKAQAALAAARVAGTRQHEIESLEQQIGAPPADPAAWLALRARVHAVDAAARNLPAELQARMRACVERVDQGCLAALAAAIAAGADGKAVRADLIAAEDVAHELTAAADKAHDHAAHQRWEQQFLAFAKQEDALVTKLYDQATIASLPWQELLPGTRTVDWAHSATAGMEHAVDGDTLTIAAHDVGDARGGVVALHGHDWRHCCVEFDAALASGWATILLRADKRAEPHNAAAVKLSLADAPDAVQLTAELPAHVALALIGSRMSVRAGDRTLELKVPAHARSGGFAVAVATGTVLRLTHLRVKELQ